MRSEFLPRLNSFFPCNIDYISHTLSTSSGSHGAVATKISVKSFSNSSIAKMWVRPDEALIVHKELMMGELAVSKKNVRLACQRAGRSYSKRATGHRQPANLFCFDIL